MNKVFCPICKQDTEQVSLLSEENPHQEAMIGYECKNDKCGTQFVIYSYLVGNKEGESI